MSDVKRLWIVDDDPVFRMIFGMMLSKINGGIQYTECVDGNDFLERLQAVLQEKGTLPEIIFLDLNMPGKSGWEVLDALNAFEAFPANEIQIFVFSSSINPEDEQNATAHPFCTGFMVKPISKKLLSKLLAQPQGK